MVDCSGVRAAVRALVPVTTQHSTPRHGHPTLVGRTNVASEQNDRWPGEALVLCGLYRVAVFHQQCGFVGKYQGECPLEGHDSHGFIPCVQYERSHLLSTFPNVLHVQKPWAVTGLPGRLLVAHRDASWRQ